MTTAKDMIIGEGLVPYIRGAPFLSLQGSRAQVHRLDPAVRAYPLDVWEHARTSAGVQLVFRAAASDIEVRLLYEEIRGQAVASLWRGEERVDIFDPKGSPGEHTLRFHLAPGSGTYTLYLPYNSVVQVAGIGPREALTAIPPQGRSWLAYGDSITHGMQASDPGLTYPAIVARLLGVDFFNLGFAGAARGEPVVAEALSKLKADVFTVAFGTNLMRFFWYDRSAWAETFRIFLELFRKGHPDTPLLVLSPIFRSAADAESRPNPMGMTVADIRRTEEAVVAARQSAGDKNLHLLSGLDVLGKGDAGLLADGIHPNDKGMEVFARRLAACLGPLFSGASPPRGVH